jgi:divalent metal cation (Fe/Co/Zn/Cd) transporter
VDGLSRKQSASREKMLATSLLLSAPGPLVTGIAVVTSQSTTQLADFLRRSVELVAIFISWWVFRRLHRGEAASPAQQARLERAAGLTTAGAMACSGVVLLVVALSRLAVFEPGGRVTLGLVIAVLGVLTNGWFWRRYAALTREQYNPVIAAQQQLYRAKTTVDLCVVAALAAVAFAPTHPVTRYIDLFGSLIVAGYMLWNGVRMARGQLAEFRPPLDPFRAPLAEARAPKPEREEVGKFCPLRAGQFSGTACPNCASAAWTCTSSAARLSSISGGQGWA